MKLKEQLLAGHSKESAQSIADAILDSPHLLEELMDCFLRGNYRLSQRAAWPVGLLGDSNPELVLPYMKDMLELLEKQDVHDALKRNSVRVLQFLEIPDEYIGLAFENCYQLLDNPEEAIAIRVFAMTVLVNICKKEPDLAGEVRLTIQKYLPYGSSGFKNRGAKLIRILEKLELNSNS